MGTTEAQTYPAGPRQRRILIGMASAFILFPLAIAAAAGAAGAAVLVIMLPFALFLFYCAYYPRLTVTPEGLNLRGILGLRSSVFVPWQSIERLRLTPGSEGLLLAEPLTDKSAERWKDWSGTAMNGAPIYDAEQRASIASARYVPFQAFAYWLEHGTLMEEFRRFAPALVEGYKERRAEAYAAGARDRKIIKIVASITGAVLVAAIFFGLYSPEFSPETQAKLDSAGWMADRIAAWTIALVFLLYGSVNLRSSWLFFRQKKIGLGIFWLIAGAIQLLLIPVLMRRF